MKNFIVIDITIIVIMLLLIIVAFSVLFYFIFKTLEELNEEEDIYEM